MRVVHGITTAIGRVGGVRKSSCHGLWTAAASVHGIGLHGRGGVVGRERATIAAGGGGMVGYGIVLRVAGVCGRDGRSWGDWGQWSDWGRRGWDV